MIVRSPWTTSTGPVQWGGGPSLGVVTDQALLEQMHSIALSIYQLKQDGVAAYARGDYQRVQQVAASIATMKGYFETAAAAFRNNDPTLNTSAFDQFILDTGNWIQAALAAVPEVFTWLPKTVVDAVFDLLTQAGYKAAAATIPVGLVALGVIGIVMLGERTRTGRKLVSRL